MNNSMFNLAIISTIVIVGIGVMIYNSVSSTINESISAMSTQEIDAFNNQFESYEGSETGSKVKALIGVLISNANMNEAEVEKIPNLTVVDYITTEGSNANKSIEVQRPENSESENVEEYTEELQKIRNNVENEHTYTVEFFYGSGGLIEEVKIYYEEQ